MASLVKIPLQFAALTLLLLLLPGCAPAILTGAALAFFTLQEDNSPCSVPGVPVEVTFQGNISFQKRPEDPESGRETEVPVRGARVVLLRLNCGEEVIASTSTDFLGDYLLRVTTPSGSLLRVSVLAERDDPASPVTVRNNSRDLLIYSFESSTRDLTEKAVQSYPVDIRIVNDCTFHTAGAFNILEQCRRGFEAIAGVLNAPDQPLTVFWELGNPDGTFFSVSLPGEDLDGDGVGSDPFIQLRGGADLCWGGGSCCHNTDQFDDAIIIHEFGHYVAHLYSRDDSPGGPHVVSELLDPRLAWSEGWADFFSALVRNNPVGYDTSEDIGDCSWPCFYFQYNVESKSSFCMVSECCEGIGSEEAVGAFLWDLYDPANESTDTVEVDSDQILNAFQALRDRRFVYVGDFIEELEDRAIIQRDAIRSLAMEGGMTLTEGDLIPFPDSFEEVVQNGTSLFARAEGAVNGCDGFCMKSPENFIGSSDFYELRIPGRSGDAGSLTASLTISPLGVRCGSSLQIRIFNEGQEYFFTTEGQVGLSREIQFDFDSLFPRGTYLLFEVTGDIPTGNSNFGQKGAYEFTIHVD